MQFQLTLQDISGLWTAFPLFSLLLIIPGFVIGRLTGILSFNKHEHQLTKSFLLSVALCPWIIYILGRFAGMYAVVGFVVFAALCFTGFLVRDGAEVLHQLTVTLRRPRVLLMLGIGLALGTCMLVDFEANGYLIRMQMSHDYVKHISVTDAVAKTGIPPVNPSFHPAEPLELFYYYFWFMLCGVIDFIGGPVVGPRDAVLAGTLWGGLGLVALVRLYLVSWGPRIVQGLKPGHYRWGYVLLAVTGVDIVVVGSDWLFFQLAGNPRPLLVNVEWWNDQIVNWTSSALWVPHHVTSFISCMVAFMIVVDQGREEAKVKPYVAWAVAAMALASALGLSIWVALVAGFIMASWLLVMLLKQWKQDVNTALMTSILAIVLALPFVLDMQSTNELGDFPLEFKVRHFFRIHFLMASIGEPYLSLVHLLVLPLNYSFELGFFALGGLLYWVYRKNQPQAFGREELFMWVLLGSSVLLCSFVRSAIVLNDMGWRVFLYAQFALLFFSIPLAARLFDKSPLEGFHLDGVMKGIAYVLLVFSCLSMLFELYSLRFRYLGPKGPQTANIRKAYEWVDANLPASTILQHNPNYEVDYFHHQYGNRQVVVADRVYGSLYGVDERRVEETLESVNMLFFPETTPKEGLKLSKDWKIDALFVKHTDPFWNDSQAWVNTLEKVYDSSCCRVYMIPD